MSKPNIWTRDEIYLKLIEVQIGIVPPDGWTVDQARDEFRRVAGQDAVRFERGADLVFTEINHLQQRIAELNGKLAHSK